MLCCVGLFGGLAVGQAMGGAWTFVAPAAGFGAGLLADMKLMKGHHGSRGAAPGAGATESAAPGGHGACCGGSSLLTGTKTAAGEMSLAEIRRTYETGPEESTPTASPLLPSDGDAATTPGRPPQAQGS